MATAVAVFAYLPYTQARRGNIIVDTFTAWLPARERNAIDAFWDLAYAALMGYVGLLRSSWQRWTPITSGETTMQRQLPIWPSIALSTALCILLAITAVGDRARLSATATAQSSHERHVDCARSALPSMLALIVMRAPIGLAMFIVGAARLHTLSFERHGVLRLHEDELLPPVRELHALRSSRCSF